MGVKDLNEKDREKYLMDNVDEQIDVMSRSVLATTLSCARCHDHKFDPIPTADYYAVAGIFRSTEIMAGVQKRGAGAAKKEYASPEMLLHLQAQGAAPKAPAAPVAAAAPGPDQQKKIDALQSELAAAQAELRTLRTEVLGANAAAGAKADKKTLKQAAAGGDGKVAKLVRQREKVQELRAQLQALENGAAPTPETAASSGPADGAPCMGVREGIVADSHIYLRGETEHLGPIGAARVHQPDPPPVTAGRQLRPQRAARAGPVAHQPREPAHRPRDGQPNLGPPVRRRARADGRQLRHHRRGPQPPRAA